MLHPCENVPDLQGTVEKTDSSQTSKKGLRSLLRGFAFGKFCQVTQADAILGIFLLRFSKPFFSNIPEVTLLKMGTDGPLYMVLGESQ